MRKRLLRAMMIGIIFISYYILTDPDTGIITDLPFGADLIFAIQVIIISLTGSVVVEISQYWWYDGKVNEEKVIDVAVESGKGAGLIYIANSIRVLAYSIIMAAAIIAIAT